MQSIASFYPLNGFGTFSAKSTKNEPIAFSLRNLQYLYANYKNEDFVNLLDILRPYAQNIFLFPRLTFDPRSRLLRRVWRCLVHDHDKMATGMVF